MKFLGIDYGKRRVGVAISDTDEKVAFPKKVLENSKNLAENISFICDEEKVGAIVIGESKNLSGENNPLMEDIRNFEKILKEKTNLPIYFETEIYSSLEAEHIQGKNKMHDASAAAIILKSFLDKRNNK